MADANGAASADTQRIILALHASQRLALHSLTQFHTPTQLSQHFSLLHPANHLESTAIAIRKYAIELYTIQDVYHKVWLLEACVWLSFATNASAMCLRAAALPTTSASFSRRLSTASRALYA